MRENSKCLSLNRDDKWGENCSTSIREESNNKISITCRCDEIIPTTVIVGKAIVINQPSDNQTNN